MNEDTVHAAALHAIVETVQAVLVNLNRGFALLDSEPEAGAKIIGTESELLSKAVSRLATSMGHLIEDIAPAERSGPEIDLKEAVELVNIMRLFSNPKCKTCGGMT